MSDIDLDITNYSIGDLETFFTLDPKQNYTSVILSYENTRFANNCFPVDM